MSAKKHDWTVDVRQHSPPDADTDYRNRHGA